MPTKYVRAVSLLAVAWAIGAVASGAAQIDNIDRGRSTVTVYAYKSGLFSAFAHDHVIRAPIAHGSVSEGPPRAVTMTIRTADLEVLDPTLAAHRRPEVLARMLSADVLDASAYPEISFSSTLIHPAGADGWMVSGRLTLHGRTRDVTFATRFQEGRYRGTVRVRQRDFGIEPVSIAGGTVKIKDEVMIVFDIALR